MIGALCFGLMVAISLSAVIIHHYKAELEVTHKDNQLLRKTIKRTEAEKSSLSLSYDLIARRSRKFIPDDEYRKIHDEIREIKRKSKETLQQHEELSQKLDESIQKIA